MLKNILKVGKALTNAKQKEVNGGWPGLFSSSLCERTCPSGCAQLGGICVLCNDSGSEGFECRIY